MKKRYHDPHELTKDDLDSINVHLYADMSDPITTSFAYLYLIQTYSDKFIHFFRHLMGHNAHVLRHPLVVKELIHSGNALVDSIGYDHYVYPGLVLAGIQFNTILITTFYAFGMTKTKSVMFERSLTNGITRLETLISQSLVVLPFIILQSVVVMIMLYVLYGFPLTGSVIEVFALLFLQSLQSLALGTTVALMFQKTLTCAVSTYSYIHG